jgi:hypothetical protein
MSGLVRRMAAYHHSSSSGSSNVCITHNCMERQYLLFNSSAHQLLQHGHLLATAGASRGYGHASQSIHVVQLLQCVRLCFDRPPNTSVRYMTCCACRCFTGGMVTLANASMSGMCSIAFVRKCLHTDTSMCHMTCYVCRCFTGGMVMLANASMSGMCSIAVVRNCLHTDTFIRYMTCLQVLHRRHGHAGQRIHAPLHSSAVACTLTHSFVI